MQNAILRGLHTQTANDKGWASLVSFALQSSLPFDRLTAPSNVEGRQAPPLRLTTVRLALPFGGAEWGMFGAPSGPAVAVFPSPCGRGE